jgi:predicted dehydrogenase
VSLRVAIIGFGASGQRAAEITSRVGPTSEILILSQHLPDGGLYPVTGSYHDVIDFHPHVVVLTGPATLREDDVEALSGIPAGFLIEKPLATNSGAAAKILRKLAGAKTVHVGYNLRFSESLRAFRAMMHGGLSGPVLSVRAETGQYLPAWRPGRDYRSTVSANASSGGGVLLELSHELDYLRWVFGDVDWVQSWFGKVSSLEVDVEDTAHLMLGLKNPENGIELVVQLNLDFVRHDQVRTVTAVCERGSLRWDGVRGVVQRFDEGDREWSTVFSDSGEATTYESQWRSFIDRLEHDRSGEVALEDGVSVLETIEAIRLSKANNGARVYLGVDEDHA